MPVDGAIIRPEPRLEQRPLADLEPLIRAILADDTIVEFGWTQFTPYYNDGEPCFFRVYTPWFRTVDDPASTENDARQFELLNDEHPSLGGHSTVIYKGGRSHNVGPYKGPDEKRYRRARALADAFEFRAFEDVLLEAFGEHALVTVRRTGITAEYYSHS